MQIQFAEIYDFWLEFLDWKTTSLQDVEDEKKEINSYVVITMDHP